MSRKISDIIRLNARNIVYNIINMTIYGGEHMQNKEFGLRLSKLRTDKGLSARDMSLSIGQNPGYINSIETGKSLPSMSAFFYICDYLGITPMEFFDTQNEQPTVINELCADLKKLDHKQLQALSILVQGMIN